MAIELIDQIKQKNNGTFPLIDSNDIKGGYYQVSSIEARDNIPAERIKIGMLCYVESTDTIYRLKSSGWSSFQVSVSGLGGGYYFGDTPPDDTSLIWIDTRITSIDQYLDSVILDEFREIISSLNNKIQGLEERVVVLELNQGGTVTSSNVLLTEAGETLLLEDGTELLLED